MDRVYEYLTWKVLLYFLFFIIHGSASTAMFIRLQQKLE